MGTFTHDGYSDRDPEMVLTYTCTRCGVPVGAFETDKHDEHHAQLDALAAASRWERPVTDLYPDAEAWFDTVGGSVVTVTPDELEERGAFRQRLAECKGCGAEHRTNSMREYYAKAKANDWAQEHAERCRSMARPQRTPASAEEDYRGQVEEINRIAEGLRKDLDRELSDRSAEVAADLALAAFVSPMSDMARELAELRAQVHAATASQPPGVTGVWRFEIRKEPVSGWSAFAYDAGNTTGKCDGYGVGDTLDRALGGVSMFPDQRA